jgi:ribose transport system substrate-binding protein
MCLLHHRRSRKHLVALATATLIGVSACSNGSSPDAKPEGSRADVAAAKALVGEYSGPMTSVDLPPLQKKPKPGKKLAIVVNSTAGALSVKDGAVAAAKVLGWTAVPIVYDAAKPTGLTDAFAQAVADAPDAVVTLALNQTDYAQAAATLKKKGIPVITSSTTDPVAPPVIANVSNGDSWAESGRVAAAYVVAKLGDKVSVAMFNLPSFPVMAAYEKAFKDEYHSLCADCHYESNPVQAGDIGTKVPTQVVSAVQRTPSINVAVMGFGPVSTGVPGALASAGLKNVKIVGGFRFDGQPHCACQGHRGDVGGVPAPDTRLEVGRRSGASLQRRTDRDRHDGEDTASGPHPRKRRCRPPTAGGRRLPEDLQESLARQLS